MNSPVRKTVVRIPRADIASRIAVAPRSEEPASKDTRTSGRSAGPLVRSTGATLDGGGTDWRSDRAAAAAGAGVGRAAGDSGRSVGAAGGRIGRIRTVSTDFRVGAGVGAVRSASSTGGGAIGRGVGAERAMGLGGAEAGE